MKSEVNPGRIARRATCFPYLRSILSDDWFCNELQKPYEQWSLITGWLNASDEDWGLWFREWCGGLEHALCFLERAMEPCQFEIIRHKVQAHCNRTQFKSVLSEIAVCTFAVSQGFQVTLESKIRVGSEKDVDLAVVLADQSSLYVEVYTLFPSDAFNRQSAALADYREPSPINYDREMRRLLQRIEKKSKKFPTDGIGFLAIDYTHYPEMGEGKYSPLDTLLAGDLELTLEESTIEGLSVVESWRKNGAFDSDEALECVGGVMGFRIRPNPMLVPVGRYAHLNPHHENKLSQAVREFFDVWTSARGQVTDEMIL
jgi:hypothetical protein